MLVKQVDVLQLYGKSGILSSDPESKNIDSVRNAVYYVTLDTNFRHV